MAISPGMKQLIKSLYGTVQDGPQPVRGEALFTGDQPYPRTWAELIGQPVAKANLQAVIAASRARKRRLDHVLLACGAHGIGKSSIARLIASELGVGMLELSGPIKVEEARSALRNMHDGDVLFIDEIHQLVAGGKVKAEWLLHLLQDGRLLTAQGAEKMPDVTVVAATTDAQSLPMTILSRFRVQPVLTTYEDTEADQILVGLTARLEIAVNPQHLTGLRRASNNSPRDMVRLLVQYDATRYIPGAPGPDLVTALEWAGVDDNGLTVVAQDYLCVLLGLRGKASLASIQGGLTEPGPLQQTENLLAGKGYIRIESGGRALTDVGEFTARQLRVTKGLAA